MFGTIRWPKDFSQLQWRYNPAYSFLVTFINCSFINSSISSVLCFFLVVVEDRIMIRQSHAATGGAVLAPATRGITEGSPTVAWLVSAVTRDAARLLLQSPGIS